jgi:hypothetical protein
MPSQGAIDGTTGRFQVALLPAASSRGAAPENLIRLDWGGAFPSKGRKRPVPTRNPSRNPILVVSDLEPLDALQPWEREGVSAVLLALVASLQPPEDRDGSPEQEEG